MSGDWSKLVCKALDSRPQLELPRCLSLPVLPQSVIAFTKIANDPEAGPHKLAASLEADPTLTSELLREINSAAMGLRQKVASVAQAIGLLGPRRTKTLVLMSALQAATKNTTSRLIPAQQFQRENYIRALFAREAARALGGDVGIAYVAGLLQDFLLPLLTEAFYSDYVEILGQGGELVEKERERFGWDHATVTAGLIRDWGFPDELVAGVLFHHDTERVVLDATLRKTSVAAVIAAGCLPESLNQSPSGVETLLVLQDTLPDFDFLKIAYALDEELSLQGQDINLIERFGDFALAKLVEGESDRIHPNQKVGQYTLEDRIGEGGTAGVYRAKHRMLKRPAAIKLLDSTKISPESFDRFEIEMQLTCGLNSPHTVAVYDYGVTSEKLCYYVMEYLEGITLAQLVQRHGPQSSGRVIRFLQQICLSLAEAHAAGLIHRDLKPENLMLCCRGGVPDTLKVLDFGLSRAVAMNWHRDQFSETISGTPRYLPPEVILDEQSLDGRIDLFSLGAVGYFLLTGQPAFPATDLDRILNRHVNVTPQRPSLWLGAPIDDHLEDLILRCLETSREDRPASAHQLHQQLGQCLSAQSWSSADAARWWTQQGPMALRESSNSVEDCQLASSPEILRSCSCLPRQ